MLPQTITGVAADSWLTERHDGDLDRDDDRIACERAWHLIHHPGLTTSHGIEAVAAVARTQVEAAPDRVLSGPVPEPGGIFGRVFEMDPLVQESEAAAVEQRPVGGACRTRGLLTSEP